MQPLSNTKANVAKVSFGTRLRRKSAPAAGKPSSATGDALDDGMKARGLSDGSRRSKPSSASGDALYDDGQGMKARGLDNGSNGVKQEGNGNKGFIPTNGQSDMIDLERIQYLQKPVCRGCGQYYEIQYCFYLFPNRLQNGSLRTSWYAEQLIKPFEKIPQWSSVRPKRRQILHQPRSGIESRMTRTQCQKVQSDLIYTRASNRSICRQYPLKNSVMLSATIIHMFNEIARFIDFKSAPDGDFVLAGDHKLSIQEYEDIDIP
jgi:hypothetical protein